MRTRHLVTAATLLAAFAFVGAGCGQNVSEPAKTAAGSNAGVKPAPSVATADVCGNPYYPFKKGLTVAYRVSPSTGAMGDSDYRTSVIDVKGTTATVRAELAGGAGADMEADCASGSVALKGSTGFGNVLQGTGFKTTVISSSGTFMPADVRAGSSWSNSETVKMEFSTGTLAVAGMGPITNTTTEDSKAIGEESITVPAGTFTAMKVQLTRNITSKFTAGPSGIKLPEMPTETVTATEWWVKGIGLVKSVTTMEGKTTTVEATSVTGQ